MAVDRFLTVERALDVRLPVHVFDERLYRKDRFGVYSGKVVPITLRISSGNAEFFQTRVWHPTQKFTVHRNGEVALKITAPINPELISWIVSWADVMRTIKPRALITACTEKVDAVKNWGKK